MAVRVVDRLEAVQVDEQAREPRPVAARLLDSLVEAVFEQQSIGQARQRIVQRKISQLLVRVVQRARQHRGALLQAAVEQRHHDRKAKDRKAAGADQAREPVLRYAAAERRSADRADRESRRGHAGVVHADDRKAHHERGGDAHAAVTAALALERVRDRERGTGRGDRHDDREPEPKRVVLNPGIHAHRGHADVVHRGNADTEDHRAAGDAPQR